MTRAASLLLRENALTGGRERPRGIPKTTRPSIRPVRVWASRPTTMRTPHLASASALRLLAGCALALSFQSLLRSAAPASAPGDELVLLKEFVVSDSQNVGYSTTNVIGVTRTNTALIDIPQTVNVLNRQFIEDVQAGELFDAVKYVSGIAIESNVGDSVASFCCA